jgi:predicted CoA-binding protein
MSSSSQRTVIADFLAQRRIAVVGVSRDPKDFSRGLFRELARRKYDVVPINPSVSQIEGMLSFSQVQDLRPPPDGVLIMTPPQAALQVIRDCAEAGVRRVWLHRGAGTGAVSEEAVALARDLGIAVVAGACPYMFLPGTGMVHRAHGGLLKLLHRHPTQRAA